MDLVPRQRPARRVQREQVSFKPPSVFLLPISHTDANPSKLSPL